MEPNALEKALHERALLAARQYRLVEVELLEVLQKLDDKKVFRSFGYSSLFQYALSELKLSESCAYQFITVARKAREIPEIKTEIKAGHLSVSKVKRIVAVIEKNNAGFWLEKAKTLPKALLEKEVAKISPRILTPERSTYVTEQRLHLQFGVSEGLHQKLLRIKDLLSQKLKRAASLENALEAMADLYIQRLDPLELARRAQHKIPQLGPGTVDISRSIPAASKHAVFLRDSGQCTQHLPSGARCEQKRWLDLHHIQHRKDGGKHSADNLTLLCFSHHQGMHGG